jgi:serine/threonine-protein kinase
MKKIPSVAIRVGDVVGGKYRVEKLLGCGGMGAVVKATHLELDIAVAVKILTLSAMLDPSATLRFKREVRAAARMRSEHAARVLDVGKTETGTPYMVMEYLEGIDFGQLLRANGRIAVHETCEYMLQACQAVAEAHALGIVHRDLKPRNLFLTKGVDGRPLVKVVDFGIAKLGGVGASVTALTRATALIGSPEYMSPEQMQSPRAVDARSDIYSLGVTLYEMLSGKLPLEADNVPSLLARVMYDDPRPLSMVAPHVPQQLAQTVMRCLAKKREERFANVAQLAVALEPYAARRPPSSADRVFAVLGEKMLDDSDRTEVAPPSPAPPSRAPNASSPKAPVATAPIPPPPPMPRVPAPAWIPPPPRICGPDVPPLFLAPSPPAPPTPVPPARSSSSAQLAFVASRDDEPAMDTWITRRRRPRLRVAAALVGLAAAAAIVVGLASASGDEAPRSSAAVPSRVAERFEAPTVEQREIVALVRPPPAPSPPPSRRPLSGIPRDR